MTVPLYTFPICTYIFTRSRTCPLSSNNLKHVLCIYLIFTVITHAVDNASNAVDVDLVKDWKDMYEDIVVTLPKKIKVLIDLKIVKQLCCLNVSIILLHI